MANRRKGRFQHWLERRDRSNQATIDATRPPPVLNTPAVVLQALTTIPDPAFAFPLRLHIDGDLVDGVPLGLVRASTATRDAHTRAVNR